MEVMQGAAAMSLPWFGLALAIKAVCVVRRALR